MLKALRSKALCSRTHGWPYRERDGDGIKGKKSVKSEQNSSFRVDFGVFAFF